ncbi:MAG: carboxypeptidase regulatory-like domain-containing protein [Lentimicrobiaceae bacterium]|nr:carboxypeptidase regulatory-like domain-containing protein [Lentimicrobiaceae bacterium]
MKTFFYPLLFLILVVFSTTQAYSQQYAASQKITSGDQVSLKVAYLEATTPSKQAIAVAENLEIIWHKLESYAIGEHAYYSKPADKCYINWTLNDQRAAQYAQTTTPVWEFPTTSDFPQAFSSKNGSMYIMADGTELYVLNPENGEPVWHKSFSESVSYAAAFPDGSGFYCSVGTYPDPFTVYAFLKNSETPVWSLIVDNNVVGISVAEDHSQLIVCLSQPAQKALIVNPTDGEVVQELFYYNNSPTQTPAFSANGEYLAVADYSGKGTLYKRISGKYEKQWQTSLQNAGSTSTWGCGTAISADGSTIAFGTLGFIPSGYMGSLYVFNNYSKEPLWSNHNFGDEVCYISMTADGSLIACASWGDLNHTLPQLHIFRKESAAPISTLKTPGSLYLVDIAPDGSKGVTSGKGAHAREMGWGGNAYCFKPVPATYGSISGYVQLKGAEDHSFALLTLEDMENYYAFSNITGDFNIKYIPAGTYKLTASKQGYYSKTIENIVITGGNTTNITIELEAAGVAVQHLFATQGAYPTVNLNWQTFEGAHTGFNIYRKLNENAPFTEILATTSATENHFVDNTALPTLDYYYAVTAVLGAGSESPFSNTALGFTSTSFITKEIDVYNSTTVPVIDGVISSGEWDDAFVFDASDFMGSDGTFQPVGSVTLYMKAIPSISEYKDLYVAVINKNDTQLSAGDRTALYIDDNNNGTYEDPGNDSEGNYWINYGPAGNYSMQYRPIYNTGGVGSVYDMTPKVAASDATGFVVAEFKISLTMGEFPIVPGPNNKSKAYIYVRDGAYGNQDGQWPFDNPETFVPIGYGTMNFFVTNDIPPAPTNLRYTPYYFNSPEFVAITWDFPQINDLGHFNITITNMKTNEVEKFEVTGTQLIFNVENLTQYHVIVTTVDQAGQESDPSEILEINTNFAAIKVEDKTFIKIYPNPAHDILYIETGTTENLQVEFFDIQGRKISHFPFLTSHSSPLTSINISHLNNGIYFVRIATEHGVVVKKAVKY